MRKTILFTGFLMLGLGAGADAQLTPKHRVDLSTPARRQAAMLSTESAAANSKQDWPRALAMAEQGLVADPNDGWLHYNKGVALFGLQRIDDAVVELDHAEQLFAPDDKWARSVAIYQRAIKLQQAGRCAESDRNFREYARLVGPVDPEAARLAMNYNALGCPVLKPAAVAARPAPLERQPVRGRTPAHRHACPPAMHPNE
jgi:tetratricopeptide (TPR) repeat protein